MGNIYEEKDNHHFHEEWKGIYDLYHQIKEIIFFLF